MMVTLGLVPNHVKEFLPEYVFSSLLDLEGHKASVPCYNLKLTVVGYKFFVS